MLDQSVTAYSVLRDRYSRREGVATSIVVGASAIVTGLALASDELLAKLGVAGPGEFKAWLAIAGIILFVVSLISSRLDWAGRSRLYGHAAEACSRLKSRYREALEGEDPSQPGRLADVRREYLITTSWLPRIPDNQFVALKAAHRRKVALSRLLDKHPFAIRWLVRVAWAARETRSALKRNGDGSK